MSFWGHMKTVRKVVKKWQGNHFSFSMRHLKECEIALLELVSSPIPCGQFELGEFQEKNRNSMKIVLNQMRLLNERLWRKKSRVR